MNEGRTDRPPDSPGDADHGEEVVILGEEDISESFKLCSKSLIERIIADWLFSVGTMKNALNAIWSKPSGFRVADLGKNLFHFFFERETDANPIVNGSPWLFKEVGRKLAQRVREVREVDLFEVKGKENRIVKARVEMNRGKKIRDSLRITGPSLDQFEVGVRYERLGVVCLYCAGLGHISRNCQVLLDDTYQDRVRQEMLGDWVKADQVGRRIFRDDFKDSTKNSKGKDNAAQPGKKPPLDWLTEGMSKMSLKETGKTEGTRREGIQGKEDDRPTLMEITFPMSTKENIIRNSSHNPSSKSIQKIKKAARQ
ncbi:hypothetical protein PIB30_033692 [Stylosanthes scabra]|uniref:CCHC-type domain-containing protein n=1 Tax=Stylosanthes scabra TaxID=79078 RepID=A0ABU6WFJ6_9FABA|nr:hypothetical protein [Stylosanthes scabra]